MAAVIAAVASTAVARWGWIDRPQHGWNVRRTADSHEDVPKSEAGKTTYKRPRTTFTVRAVGTAVVHNVEVRVHGAPVGSGRLYQATMSAGSEPIVFDAYLPKSEDSKVYIEIVWTRLRPYRAFGQRFEARSLEWQNWQWNWTSIRFKVNGKWTAFPARTTGDWVSRNTRPRVEIPEGQ
ncbi:hypothetical protein [Streptomyces sp. A5-4]|uniref:hypothetical protein n=1 Tax=Streptomyces sp. A5-4 TaxID=3384771 RepID=UPI003DA922F9